MGTSERKCVETVDLEATKENKDSANTLPPLRKTAINLAFRKQNNEGTKEVNDENKQIKAVSETEAVIKEPTSKENKSSNNKPRRKSNEKKETKRKEKEKEKEKEKKKKKKK